MAKSILFLSLLFLSSCVHGDNQRPSATEWPTQRELYQAARKTGKLTIVYGAQLPEFKAQYQSFLGQFSKGRRYQELEIISDQEFSTEDAARCNCLFIGSPQSNTFINSAKNSLPISFSAKGISFNKNLYSQTNDVFALIYYPNPANRQMPYHLLTANNDQAVLDLLKEKFKPKDNFQWYGWGYELYRANRRILMGYFSEKDWSVDEQSGFDFTEASDLLYQSEHFTFYSHKVEISNSQIKTMAATCETNYSKILALIGAIKPAINIQIHLYATAEEKGLMTNNTSQSHCDFKRQEIHLVYNDLYPAGFSQRENEIILRTVLGKPKTSILETGLSLQFNEKWQKEGYAFWAARLFLSGNELSLKDLLSPEMQQKESNLVINCMAASFVEFLIKKFGKSIFIENYATWQIQSGELKSLESEWKSYALSKAKTYRDAIANRQSRDQIAYMKGFNFAHEGYNIYNGYISQKAKEALDKLQHLGGNAVAIVPYSYMRSPNVPTSLPIPKRAGSENDESVIHAAYQAQQLGMTTLLKPQIWLGRSWPGDVEMYSEKDWQQFFDCYYRWIRHYALIAEIHQMDILCIGVEFAKATIQRPDDWKQIIRKIRGLYSGRLTYAANWGDEFEKSALWDELDYIGINSYYPLSKADQVSKKELKQNFEKVIHKIEKVYQTYKKPVLFTEIGFRSVQAPWKNPHAGADGRSYAPEHQALCYEVIFEGIQNKDWCEGIFWWKWPSYLEYQGNRNDSFTPNRKAAEKVVKEWFEKVDTQ